MEKFSLVNLEKLIYPTPHERKKDAIFTDLSPGDIVRVKVDCPVKGKIGIVVVERNDNYHDYEPYSSKESIGIGFAEEAELSSSLKKIVQQLTEQNSIVNVVRWFESSEDLEILEKAE